MFRFKKTLAAVVLLLGIYTQQSALSAQIPKITVAQEFSCPNANPVLAWITDGNSATDCTVGGGSNRVLCQCINGVWSAVSAAGGSGAPTTVDYLVKTADGTLSAERVVGDSTSVTANWASAGAVTFERAALSGDVSASANSNTTAIGADKVTEAMLKAVNSPTDEYPATYESTTGDFEWQKLTTAGMADDAVTDAILRESAGVSVIGRSANSTGNPADIAASADGQVLRRGSGSVAFGAIDLADPDAVTGVLAASHLPSDANVVVCRFSKNTITATTTLTTLASCTVPAGTMGTNSVLVAWLWGSYFNNSGAQRGLKIRLVVGGTTLIDAASPTTYLNANATDRRPYWMQVSFSNVGATNVNWSHISFAQSSITPGGAGGTTSTGKGGFELGFSGAGGQFSSNGESAIDTSASQTFDIQMAMNNGTATQEIIIEAGVLLLQ